PVAAGPGRRERRGHSPLLAPRDDAFRPTRQGHDQVSMIGEGIFSPAAPQTKRAVAEASNRPGKENTMGMDVYGKEPRSEKGEYFRTTEAYWHPLADYVCVVAPSISSKCRYWHSNDGDGLNDEDRRSLAIVLREVLSSGRTADY